MEPIATKAAETSIALLTSKLIDKLPLNYPKDRFDELKLVLDKGLPDYLQANYSKCETLKTLLNRNDPVSITECFVAPNFKIGDKNKTSEELLSWNANPNCNAVVTGLAGSGKSVFLKYAFRATIEQGHTYYPIFFELRNLNKASLQNRLLFEELFKSVSYFCESFNKVQFRFGLKQGAFYFLLDGFDELNSEIRDQVAQEINEFAQKYSKCSIIVTSRPSDEFISWEGFHEVKLQPFTLEQATEYLTKLRFDQEKKSDFIADLENGLFEKNKDFLSNPLLTSMMLLTYDAFGEIPEKRHVFYSKCFDVLSTEHDASKGRYKRKLFSELTIDQLESAFTFFCALSYSQRTFTFSEQQMADFTSQAIRSAGINSNTDDVIRDFRESISIIEKVGQEFEFAHRSFQEYFYAKFVVKDRKLPLIEKIEWLLDKFRYEDTVEMIADMDPSYFEDEFLLPRIRKITKQLIEVDTSRNPAGVHSKIYASINSEKRTGEKEETRTYFVINDTKTYYLVQTALWKYYDIFGQNLERLVPANELDPKERYDLLNSKFGNQIKIHHTNNKKLIEIGANQFAERIKVALNLLAEHLEQKAKLRCEGINSLISSAYP